VTQNSGSKDSLNWLVEWFASHCDGEWEHQEGVVIENLDNPGWSLKISLRETALENVPFEAVEHNYNNDVSWWRCWVEHSVFHAACGARDLASVVDVFRQWSTQHERSG
jgi:hypothetical protein